MPDQSGREATADCENCLGTGETFACILYGQCEPDGCVSMDCPCMTPPARETTATAREEA